MSEDTSKILHVFFKLVFTCKVKNCVSNISLMTVIELLTSLLVLEGKARGPREEGRRKLPNES